MSACHVLLGRSWKFDRGAIHDYTKNNVIVDKDGKKFVLIPLKDEKEGKERNLSVFKTSSLRTIEPVVKVGTDERSLT